MRELSAAYDNLAGIGRAALHKGDFATALEAYEAALGRARRLGDRARIDRAELNRAMVLIQMDQARKGEEGLREILLRTPEDEIAWSAAYNLAASLRRQGRYTHAASYARRAMDKALALGTANRKAATHNLLGNILLNQNYFDEALGEYHHALAIRVRDEGDHRFSLAILHENIGYCLLLKSRFDEGIEYIRTALRLAEEVGDRRCRTECLQDLCYAHLLQGNYIEAAAPGVEALSEAMDAGYVDIEENCHYLLGELGTRTDDDELRDLHFGRLQEMHPELPFLREFLCSVDVTSIVTLKR